MISAKETVPLGVKSLQKKIKKSCICHMIRYNSQHQLSIASFETPFEQSLCPTLVGLFYHV